MPERKTAKRQAAKSAPSKKPSGGFTAEERQAMKDRAREMKSAARGAEAERELVAKIAALPEPDRTVGRRIHDIVKRSAPDLEPRLWYGMPAYSKGGKVLCFFQPASKFKARYATLGFNDVAALDDGNMWATAFAITELTAAEEAKITKLVKKAAR